MSFIDAVRYRWRAAFRRADLDQEIEEELRHYAELDRRQRAGAVTTDATRVVNTTYLREELRHMSRTRAVVDWVFLSLTDVRAAARGLVRTPSVTVSAVICLALGIGATTAIASAIQRALLTPLPFRAPDRLVALFRSTPQTAADATYPESVPNYVDLARTSHRLAGLAAITDQTSLVTVNGHGAEADVATITGNLFSLLGVAAERGRLITPADDRMDQPAVAVVSDRFWRSSLGADPSIVGRSIAIDGRPTTIVGVAPPGFKVPVGPWLFDGDFWMPIRFTPDQLGRRGANYLMMVGRLANGATLAEAQAEVRTLFAGLVSSYPELTGESLRVAALAPASVQDVRTPLLLVFGAVALVLMIAASNVAALLLARGVGRRVEMALRISLGATRWDAMRVALAESLLLTLVGAAIGIGLAEAGVRTIGAVAGERVPQLAGLGLDVPVVVFGLALAVLVALVCGAVPAWRAASVDPQRALRAARGTSKEQHRSLRSLVAFEIGLSVVLVVSAGLVLKGFSELLSNPPGFETAHVLTLKVTAPATSYPDSLVEARFLHPVLDAIGQIPGVESVGAVSAIPYVSWGRNGPVRYEGQPATDPSHLPLVEFRIATPGFFAVSKQRLVAGRVLRASDDGSPTSVPVVVVNQALVRRDFHGRNPVGSRFYITDTSFATIVGVVSDVRNFGPISPPVPEMYWSYDQLPGSYKYPLMVRVKGDNPAAVAGSIQSAVHRVDRDAAVSDVMPMRDVIAGSLGQPRFYLSLLGTFAAVAVVLALAGLYGVLAYVVAQRTKEMGIRSALGGSAASLIGLVTRDGLRMVAGGLVIGLPGAWAATRLIAFMLYGVSPLDSFTWIIASMAVLGAGMLITLVPAVRAARSDPVVAMRAD